MTAMSRALLSVWRISKRFGGVCAVDGMSLDVSKGEIVALIGPNGAGKTTLFNILSGISRADSGDIFLAGSRITNLPSWKVAKLGIGRTFQNIRLFDGLTVVENVALAQGGRQTDRLSTHAIADLLDWAGLSEYANLQARSLPYGLRRRVEIARALAGSPVLLLLDEPTAGMNPREAAELTALTRELSTRRLGILLIEHNMRVALAAADRVVVMNLGRKLAEGSPTSVRQDPAVIEAYLGESGD